MGSYREEQELRGCSPPKVTPMQFTTHELQAELDRRRIAKENEFQELAREMYNLGYSYQDLDTMISEC